LATKEPATQPKANQQKQGERETQDQQARPKWELHLLLVLLLEWEAEAQEEAKVEQEEAEKRWQDVQDVHLELLAVSSLWPARMLLDFPLPQDADLKYLRELDRV
jgi:hypothetical protein